MEIILKLLPFYTVIFITVLYKYIFNPSLTSKRFSTILRNILVPIIFFRGAIKAAENPVYISLSFFVFVISIILSLILFRILKHVKFKDPGQLAYIMTTSNTGNYGLVLVSVILGQAAIAPAVMVIFGSAVFANTIGYGLISNRVTLKNIIKNIFKLPATYGVFFGIMCASFSEIILNNFIFNNLIDIVMKIFAILGAIVVGSSIPKLKNIHKNFRIALLVNIINFTLLPVLFLFLAKFLRLDEIVQKAIFLQYLSPLAVNSIVAANYFGKSTDIAATSILISLFISITIMPVATLFLDKL